MTSSGYWIGCVVSLVIHEAAHVCTGLLFGLRVKRVGISWRGPYIVRETGVAMANMIVSAAGPLANILLGALTWRSWPSFAIVNLVLGFANLLPTKTSDGGRIIRAFSALRRAEPRAEAAPEAAL
jgi:Zn-dependent protease